MTVDKSVAALSAVLRFTCENPTELAEYLIEKYHSVIGVLSAPTSQLCDDERVGKRTAIQLKLAGALLSRKECEKYKFGATHTAEETDNYIKAKCLICSVETVFLLSFDKAGRAIGCDLVSSGTVNSSDISPRAIVNFALSRGADRVILAHNHPRGVAKPSQDDIVTTANVAHVLRNSGVKLLRHIIVAPDGIYSINEPTES